MGPASALRALALLGCCAQLARAGAGYHVGKIREYGDPEYYTQLKDIDPSHGQLKQADNPTQGFDPAVTEYTVRIDDESITEVVFTLVLDFTYYNLMYTPELTFYNGTGEGGDIMDYSPLDVIHLKVPLDVDSENKTFIGPYDKTAWVKLTDPESKGGIGGFGEKSTKYNIRVLQPPLYKDACQAERIVVRNSTEGEAGTKDSHPPFEKGSPNHRYEYIFQDKTGHVKFECPNVEDVVAKIDGEGQGSNIATLDLDLDKDVRWNLVATCEYHDTRRNAKEKQPDSRFPSQIRSYDLVIEKRTNVNELARMVKDVMLTAQLGYCEQVDKSELVDGGEWEDLRAIYEGECCDWDDVECKACEDGKTMAEYCKQDPTTHGCELIMAATSAAPATMASTTMAPAQDSGVCGNVHVKDCKAREEAGQSEHQFCMFHKETRGCEDYNHHARRLDVVPRDFGYQCRVKDLADGEQIELVVLFEEGSPDAFLQGNMITEPGQKPTPQKLRVMNGVPISFETKAQRSKFMLNIQAGEHLIKVPIEIKVPAMCPDKDFCRDGLVARESSCEKQVCPQEYMCKGDPCKLEDDQETCCAKPATCQTFKTENKECMPKQFGLTSFPRKPRPGDDIKDHMCQGNICHSFSDSDACCQSRDDTKNGTVATHLHPTDKVVLPGCLKAAEIVGRCEGEKGGWKVDVTGCGCPGKESSQCWTPSVGDVVKLGDQRAVISESENPYAEDPGKKLTVNMAPSKDDVNDGLWIWVFTPGDTVVVPLHGDVHEQDGTLRTSLDFKTGKWLIDVVDRGSDGYRAAIKRDWSFFAFGDTYHGKVVSGPAADGSFLVNFTENKGFEPGEIVVTKGARAEVKDGFQGTGATGMYTVQFPNDNNGKYTVISYPIPSYDIHAYHNVTTNKTNGKTNTSTDGRYKPGDEVNVVGKGPGIVVFGPDNGQYLVTDLSTAETLGVPEGNITGLVHEDHHEGHISFMQKDRAEGPVVGAMRLGSAWGLPLALAAVGAVTAMTLVVLRRQSLRSLRETSRSIHARVNPRDQDRLLPAAADMESA